MKAENRSGEFLSSHGASSVAPGSCLTWIFLFFFFFVIRLDLIYFYFYFAGYSCYYLFVFPVFGLVCFETSQDRKKKKKKKLVSCIPIGKWLTDKQSSMAWICSKSMFEVATPALPFDQKRKRTIRNTPALRKPALRETLPATNEAEAHTNLHSAILQPP